MSIPAQGAVGAGQSYQERVRQHFLYVAGEDTTDMPERRDRACEEFAELQQALGGTLEGWIAVGRYVWGRPIGEPAQEMGGTLNTLAALAAWADLDMMACAEAELERTKQPEIVAKIRRKRANRHGRGVLPGNDADLVTAALASPRADSDERTADDAPWPEQYARLADGYGPVEEWRDWTKQAGRDPLSPGALHALRGMVGEFATPAQPAGAVPDSLREALEFYADQWNADCDAVLIGPGANDWSGGSVGYEATEDLSKDAGARARKALRTLAAQPAATPAVPDSLRAILLRARSFVTAYEGIDHPVVREIDALLAAKLSGQVTGVPVGVQTLSDVKQGVVALRDQARSNLAFYEEHGSDLALLESQNLAAYEAVLSLFVTYPDGQSAGTDVVVSDDYAVMAAAEDVALWLENEGRTKHAAHVRALLETTFHQHWLKQKRRGDAAEAALVEALAARPAAPEAQGAPIVCDVLTMRLSDGRADYFTRITSGGREITPYKFSDRYKAQYSADEFAWLLGLRPDKPDLMAYDEASYPKEPAPPASSGQEG